MMYIYYGGELLDVDESTNAGFSYTSNIIGCGGGMVRSVDLSVPATRKNNSAFRFSEIPASVGVRQAADGAIFGGGVYINGKIFVVDYTEGRYKLMFAYGKTLGLFNRVNNHAFMDTALTVSQKDNLPRGGAVPDFGFYGYNNGVCDGLVVGSPTSLLPSANLGFIIDTLAAVEGYTVVYPDISLGRVYQAAAYGLVLPKTDVFAKVEASGSGSARDGFSVSMSDGSNLSDWGLITQTRRYKRGAFGENVTVHVFAATEPVTVTFAEDNEHVVASGMGYDILNTWEGGGCEVEMAAGWWFTVVSKSDWYKLFGVEVWRGSALTPRGYETAINFSFGIGKDEGYASDGNILYMDYLMPELTLKQYLDAYCDIINAVYDTDASAKTITIIPRDYIISNLRVWMALEKEKIVNVGRIARYVDGWSQNNIVDCDSAEYVPQHARFRRNYKVYNDYLTEERTVATIPFNEGDYYIGLDGEKLAWFDDVTIGDNGDVNYNGRLSVFLENTLPGGRLALHLQTVNDMGVGVPYSEFTGHAVCVDVDVVMPLFRFFELDDYCGVSWNGCIYAVESATWSDGVCSLKLLSVNI